jgi:hypothetical protein
MNLQCPACQKTVPAGDASIGVDLVRCMACGKVFRPNAAMPTGSDAADDESLPPKPEAPSAGTKVRIEDRGGALLVRFPPFGFNVALVFLIAFTIAWWSFLGAFIGFGISGVIQADHQERSQPTAIEAERPLESKTPAAEEHSDKDGNSRELRSAFLGVGVVLAGLFMSPFFAAGLLMIWGILGQVLGQTRVRLATGGCSYRRSVLGLGRTRTASLVGTCIRWMDEPPPPGHRRSGTSAMPSFSTQHAEPNILLALGSWETPIGASLSLREQEWVFREMRAWLKRYAELEPRHHRR